MSRSMASAARQMQSNTVRADLSALKAKDSMIRVDLTSGQIASNQAVSADNEPFVQPVEPLVALVDEARIICGLSLKEMAISAEVNFGTFCDAMNGKKNFCISWLDPQPIHYRITFARLLSRKYGISREAERAIVIRRLFDSIEELLLLTVVSE